jgi:hypothetical protein
MSILLDDTNCKFFTGIHNDDKNEAVGLLYELAIYIHYQIKDNNESIKQPDVFDFKPLSKGKYCAYERTCHLFGAEPLKPIGWEI